MDLLNLIFYFIVLLCVIVVGASFHIWRCRTYWPRHDIPSEDSKCLREICEFLTQKENKLQKSMSIYKKYKHRAPMVGRYLFLEPTLLITDLQLVQNIFIKDFDHFQIRMKPNSTDPITANLFTLGHEKWRPRRLKLSPSFSMNKIKLMVPLVVAVADKLVICIDEAIQSDCDLQIGEWMAKYTIDVIGKCTMGIECNSLRDPEMKLLRMFSKIFDRPKISVWKLLLGTIVNKLSDYIEFKHQHKQASNYFLEMVKEIVAHRENNNVKLNDLMNTLIEMKNSPNEADRISIEEIAAEAFVFFIGGFETSATALEFCLYELSLELDIQSKARKEVRAVLEKYDGNLTHEALMEMTFIGQITNGISISEYYEFSIERCKVPLNK